MFLHSVSFLAFSQIMRAETPQTEGKQQHGTLQSIFSLNLHELELYLAFCRYIFSQTKIIISHVRRGDKFPFSAGAAGIKAVLLNGTGLPEANCGPRIKLCRHPNMTDMWRSADEISWKAYLMAYTWKLISKIISHQMWDWRITVLQTTEESCNRILRTNNIRKTL